MAIRKHIYIVNRTILTGLTAREVKRLDRVLCPPGLHCQTITPSAYIAQYSPQVTERTAKSGRKMYSLEVLHNVISDHRDWIEFPDALPLQQILFRA